MDKNRKPVVSGESQVAINKKWLGIIVGLLVVFVLGVGWMYQVVATARPVTTDYAQSQHK